MRTQIHNEHWKWIVWLIILILLNAIAVSAGRPPRGGRDRSSSDARVQSEKQQASQPTETRQQPATARESRSAVRTQSRPQRTESAPSVSQSDTPRREVRSRQQSEPANPVVSSPSQTRTVERSRPVRREVIVAPSSQSLDVSSSTTVTRSAPSVSSPSTSRVGRSRSVEVKQVSSEQRGNSAVSVTQPTRRDRTTETIQTTADQSSTSQRSGSVSNSSKQSRDRVERITRTQSKDSDTVSSPSSTTAVTAKSQDSSIAAAPEAKSGSSTASVITGNSRNSNRGTVIRREGTSRNTESVVAGSDDAKVQPQRSRLLRSDIQLPAKEDKAVSRPSQNRIKAPSEIATRSEGRRGGNSDLSGIQSDSRWSKLRSKITASADLDMNLRDGRSGGGSHIQRDQNRGRVVVRDDNIHIERGDRDGYHRPFVSCHLFSDIRPIRRDHRWEPCGSSFVFRWSDSSCGRVLLAPYHSNYGISYYYPSYHRKYLFVSLGGYWPYSYRYQRYYWYGCHPYYWYGSYVMSEPDTVVYDYTTTYNYYTAPTVTTVVPSDVTTDVVEDSTATDTPLPQTQADIRFANAVNAFEEGRYDYAVGLFREAVIMSPDDEILPFTYTQALFATGDYALAVHVLREVMAKMPSEESAVYFPRGLYKEDQILMSQIAGLENAIAIEPFSTDYQLLLGYQYLGVGQWDRAVNALEQAARNPLNANTVNRLLDIAEKMENSTPQDTITNSQN